MRFINTLRGTLASATMIVGLFVQFAQESCAAIVLTVQSSTFEQNSGVQSLSLLGRSNESDSIIAFAGDIRLAAGDFAVPPGTFLLPGQIGSGNNAGSLFTRASSTLASLSLDFNTPQLFPASDGILATVRFNVNGLNPGNYGVTFEQLEARTIANALVQTIGNAGTFTINQTTVPEPSTIFLVAVSCTIGFYNRLRNYSKKYRQLVG